VVVTVGCCVCAWVCLLLMGGFSWVGVCLLQWAVLMGCYVFKNSFVLSYRVAVGCCGVVVPACVVGLVLCGCCLVYPWLLFLLICHFCISVWVDIAVVTLCSSRFMVCGLWVFGEFVGCFSYLSFNLFYCGVCV